LPADKIVSRFLDRSVEIRIHDYRGKNWIFAVPKTQCAVLVRNCKVTQKTDKLIVSIGKMSEADNWFSLHKVKCVGEKDTD
jgi:calcyclin binding protein